MIAVISDVHGNLEALEAVLAQIDALGIETIYSLGDVVGYGPDPEACVRLVAERCCLRLAGNHEYGVLHADHPEFRFNATAEIALEWTRRRLQDAGLLDWIAGLPSSHQLGELLFVHGTVRDPLGAYLLESDGSGLSAFDAVAESLASDFTSFRICFVGHNHRPFLATSEGFLHPHDRSRTFQLPADEKLYVSVGSVGQPRDRDPRACFVTFDGLQLSYHRVAYPHARTAAKIRAHGLPGTLADRLATGR